MANKYPFHYEVRFRLIAYDSENNVEHNSYVKTIICNDPIEAREEAFGVFDDYVSLFSEGGKITKDYRGNYKITQPAFVLESLNKENETDEDSFEWLEKFKYYKQEISIFLIVTDENLAKEVLDSFTYNDMVEQEFKIHKIASYKIDEQDIVDNLEFYELSLFNHFKIDISNLKRTVYHYGLDYADSGEDVDSGAKREVLETPHIWQPIEEYNEVYNSNKLSNEFAKNIHYPNYEEIIARGERHQIEFKPALLYNFKTKKAGISVKYIIAKAICGFLNSSGGVLFIGVNDSGEIQGLEDYDYSLFKSINEKDKILLEFDSLIAYFFGKHIMPLIDASIEVIDSKSVLVIVVQESSKPILLKNKRNEEVVKELFIRLIASTRQLTDIEEIIEYLMCKNWKKPSTQ